MASLTVRTVEVILDAMRQAKTLMIKLLLIVTFTASLATVRARAPRDGVTMGTGVRRSLCLTERERLVLCAVRLHLLLIILAMFQFDVLV